MNKLKLEEMEDVDFKIDEKAFKREVLYCDKCDKRLKKAETEIMLDQNVSINLNSFRCPKCGKDYLNFEEAKKLDKALILNRLISEKGFSLKRKLSFDGDNSILRIPTDLLKGNGKQVADIKPLSTKQYLISVS